jgi:glutamyl-tRNA reductase
VERRLGRPLTIVALSLPRNIEPEARHVVGVHLLDLDDLVADTTELQVRRREEIVADELRRYRTWLAGREAGHLIARLHDHIHAVCLVTIEASLAGRAAEPDLAQTMARSVAKRMLHGPTVTIKALVETGDHAAVQAVMASYGIVPQVIDPEALPFEIDLREAS